ncbi:hypothetical protein ACFPVY_03935 [Flavobacterium qiangtangense]|uniref:Uncharacterized protein n=1 Tax=Flavobacterium qiangtangense TaxID=1442595 RepID=A0ABW1PLF7_9FLAO
MEENDDYIINDKFMQWWNSSELKIARAEEVRLEDEKFSQRLREAREKLGKLEMECYAQEKYINGLEEEKGDAIMKLIKDQLTRGKRDFTIKNILS